MFSVSAFSLRRFNGLKCSSIEGFAPEGSGFLLPKKSLGVGSRNTGRGCALDLGLEAALGAPVGLKALAAGLGLKSGAFTLNLAEAAEVGVRSGVCEPGTGAALIEGLLGGF